MLIAVITGMLFWQMITTATFIATHENEEMALYVGGGIPFWILVGIATIIRKILITIRYWNVRSILIDENGNWFHAKHTIVQQLREEKDVDFPDWTDELKAKYPRTMWGEYFQKNCCCFDVGNFRYAPKEIWSQFPELKA